MASHTSRNLLLQQLSSADRLRLEIHLQRVELAFKQTLCEQDRPVEHVYFPETAVISLVTTLSNGESVETAIVGNEGLVGLSVLLGASRAAGRAFCQVPGHALRLSASVLAAERERGGDWALTLLRYANFVNSMMAQSAACNRLHSVEARLGRWLLMIHDRVEANRFPLTQDLLARMLGVPTADMIGAGASLQSAGLIDFSRGWITIRDREGLESMACECYRRVSEQLRDSVYVTAASG